MWSPSMLIIDVRGCVSAVFWRWSPRSVLDPAEIWKLSKAQKLPWFVLADCAPSTSVPLSLTTKSNILRQLSLQWNGASACFLNGVSQSFSEQNCHTLSSTLYEGVANRILVVLLSITDPIGLLEIGECCLHKCSFTFTNICALAKSTQGRQYP